MPQTPEFGRRVIVTCDAKGYGGSDELTQHQFQEAIPALLGIAAVNSGPISRFLFPIPWRRAW